MDFAENLTCTSAEEVQSAYWNSSEVTLHPVVTYYRAEDGTLTHDNYVFVSDDLAHNFGTLFAILDQLMQKNENESPTSEINRNLQPVKGTMQIHCVIGMEKGIIATSTTSSDCSDCLEAKCHKTSEACLLKSQSKEIWHVIQLRMKLQMKLSPKFRRRKCCDKRIQHC